MDYVPNDPVADTAKRKSSNYQSWLELHVCLNVWLRWQQTRGHIDVCCPGKEQRLDFLSQLSEKKHNCILSQMLNNSFILFFHKPSMVADKFVISPPWYVSMESKPPAVGPVLINRCDETMARGFKPVKFLACSLTLSAADTII